jgi:hypothetical protein
MASITKKLKFVALSALIIFILYKTFSFYSVLKGNPWLKYVAQKKFEIYLEDVFESKMIIKSVQYNIKTGDYFARVTPPDLDFEFQLNIYDGIITHNYFSNYWEFQAKNELIKALSEVSDLNPIIYVNIYADRDMHSSYETFGEKLPDYDTVKNQLDDMKIYIDFEETLSYEESDKLFTILNIVKESFPCIIRV